MIAIDAGHLYEVSNADGDGTQRIQFVVRRDLAGEPLPPERRREGILSQELLRVLIDRTLYLNSEDPCDEDVQIVHKLRDCLRLYESRAARRTIEKLSMPEHADTCDECGHILCGHER